MFMGDPDRLASWFGLDLFVVGKLDVT